MHNNKKQDATPLVFQTGGVVGGYAFGNMGAIFGGAIVVSLSITILPAVLIVVGLSTATMAIVGSGLGKAAGEKFYETLRLDEFLKEIENQMSDDIAEEMEEYIIDQRSRNFISPLGF